jgi:hypothetical protein
VTRTAIPSLSRSPVSDLAAVVVLMLGALLLVPSASAQRIEVGPQAIVVNPRPAFDVDVWVDRDRGGRSEPTYFVGEDLEIGVRVSEDAYIYLFSLGASGDVVQVLPNRYDGGGRDNFVRAGATRTFPPAGARYGFVVDGPNGLARVVAVASRSPLDTRTLASFGSDRDFVASSSLGDDGFARALSIVVQPLPLETWVTATARYRVGLLRASEPRVGSPPPAAPRVEPINAYLGLLPYPGSVVMERAGGGRDSETAFATTARLGDVYAHFHEQLVRDGWRRIDLDVDDDEIEAEYRRSGVTFELELEYEGRDRYELEIDFD